MASPLLVTSRGSVLVSLDLVRGRSCTFPLPNTGMVSPCTKHEGRRSNMSLGAYTGSAVVSTFSKVIHLTGPCCTCKGMVIMHRCGKLRAICDRGSGGLIGPKSCMGTKRPVTLAKHAKETAARRLRFRMQMGKRRFGPGLMFSLRRQGLGGRYLMFARGNNGVTIGPIRLVPRRFTKSCDCSPTSYGGGRRVRDGGRALWPPFRYPYGTSVEELVLAMGGQASVTGGVVPGGFQVV